VVLISGEPGIGKSRLMAALSEHIEAEPHTRLRYFCSPHHQDSALYPFIAQLERAAGFARDDTVDAKLGKFRALLATGSRDDGDITLLSELLSLPEFRRGPQPQPAAKTGAAVRRVAQSTRKRGAAPTGVDGVRGCALDRSELA
jgi:predicted ATPase